MATPIFQPVPCLMVVGSDDGLANEAARALPGITHLRVAHVAAAVERMLVTRPLVVIVDESVAGADFERVAECARDIRAEILRASIPLRANPPLGARRCGARACGRALGSATAGGVSTLGTKCSASPSRISWRTVDYCARSATKSSIREWTFTFW